MSETPLSTADHIRMAVMQLLAEEAFPDGLEPTRLPMTATTARYVNARVLVKTPDGIFMGVIHNIRPPASSISDVYVRDYDNKLCKVTYGPSCDSEIWLLSGATS